MRKSILAWFSLNRPVTVCMLFLFCLVLGTISYQKIPLQLLPSGFTRSQLSIRVIYPNAAPEEAVRKVAEPIEGMMATISGVKEIRTVAQNSRVSMDLTFGEGISMDFAYREVQERMERVRPQLPEDIKSEDIIVFKRSTDDIPVAAIAISYPEDIKGLNRMIDVQVKSRLNRIDGVANVDVFGISDQEIFVDLTYDRVKASGVGLYQLIQNFRASSVTLPSGYAYEGNKKLFIRTLARFKSLDEIKKLPVTEFMRLREVGEVNVGMPAPPFMSTLEGKPAILLIVHKESNANTVEVCDKIEKFVEENPLPNLESYLIFAQGNYIKKSVTDLQTTALWGALFAVLILLVFLRRLSLTFVVTLAVPTSLVITIVVMYFTGQSLNIISLMGIMLAVGMLVDNSVVVVESIARESEEGKSPRQAALDGTSQVSLAIITATLTTTVVFLPFFLVESSFKFWLKELGVPICVSMVASLLVALIFIPLAASKFLITPEKKSTSSTDTWSNRLYGKILRLGVKNRFEAMIIILLLLSTIYIPIRSLAQTDRVQGHSGSVRISLRFPGARSLGDVARRVETFEKELMKHKKELGVELIRSFYSTRRGGVTLHLPSDKKPKLTPARFYERLKEIMPRVPGVEAHIQGDASNSSTPQVQLQLVGKDPEILYQIASNLKEKLLPLEEVLDVELDAEHDSDEIHAKIRKDLTEKFQISPQVVSGTIRYSLNGAPLPAAVIGNREVDTRVALRAEDRENLSLLKDLEVQSPRGQTVSLGALVDFEVEKSLEKIVRVNKKNQITLTVTTSSDSIMNFYRKMYRVVGENPMPEGYSLKRGSRFAEFQELKKTGIFALTLDVIFVFLLMGVLFESFLLPLCVMASLPFAFLGVYWILYLTGTPMETMSVIGMVILVGIVVNNAIVLIDRVGQYRQLGYSREDAIVQGGRERIRPILMTAFTTIFGLIPMALGDSNMFGRPYYPLGRAVIGGLLASTVITLFVVPVFYSLLLDLQDKIKNIMGLK